MTQANNARIVTPDIEGVMALLAVVIFIVSYPPIRAVNPTDITLLFDDHGEAYDMGNYLSPT